MTPFGYPVLQFLAGEVLDAEIKLRMATRQETIDVSEVLAAEGEYLAKIGHLFNFIELWVK